MTRIKVAPEAGEMPAARFEWVPWVTPELLVLLLLNLVAGGFLLKYRFSGLSDEAMEVLQIARHISEGAGWSTDVITPLGLSVSPRLEGHPDLRHPPAPAGLLSLFFLVTTEPSKRMVAAWIWGLFLLSGLLLYRWAFRCYGRPVAAVAAGMYLLDGIQMSAASSGEPAMLVVLLLGFWLLLSSTKSVEGLAQAFLWGLLTGCLLLSGASLWVPVLVSIGLAWKRWLPASSWQIVFSLGLFLVVGAWGIRNIRITGTPFLTSGLHALLLDTPAYPGDAIYRWFPDSSPQLAGMLWHQGGAIFVKTVRNSVLALKYGWTWIPFLLLALAGIIRPARELRTQHTRHFTWLLIASVGIATFSTRPGNQLILLLPLLCTYAAIAALDIAHRIATHSAYVLTWPLVLAIVLLVSIPLGSPSLAHPLPRAAFGEIHLPPRIKAFIDSADYLISDRPAWLAWESEKPVVWRPTDTDQLELLLSRLEGDAWLWMTAGVFQAEDPLAHSLQQIYVGQEDVFDWPGTDVILSEANWLVLAPEMIDRPQSPPDLTGQERKAVTRAMQAAAFYLRLGDWTQARELLRRILRIAPHHEAARWLLTRIEQGAADGVSAGFRKSEPTSASLFQIGLLYQEQADWPAAARAYSAALLLDPEQVFAANNLAWAMSRMGYLTPALKLGRYALHLKPANPWALDTVGWILYRIGRQEESILLLRKATQIAPDHPAIQAHLVQASSGRPQE